MILADIERAEDARIEREDRINEIHDAFNTGGASLRELIEYSDFGNDALTGMCLTDALNEAKTLLLAAKAAGVNDSFPHLRAYLSRFDAAQERYHAECLDIDCVPGAYEKDCQERENKRKVGVTA